MIRDGFWQSVKKLPYLFTIHNLKFQVCISNRSCFFFYFLSDDCALRIGVNAGSLEKDLQKKYGEPNADALVESAMRHVNILLDNNYESLEKFKRFLSKLKFWDDYVLDQFMSGDTNNRLKGKHTKCFIKHVDDVIDSNFLRFVVLKCKKKSSNYCTTFIKHNNLTEKNKKWRHHVDDQSLLAFCGPEM